MAKFDGAMSICLGDMAAELSPNQTVSIYNHSYGFVFLAIHLLHLFVTTESPYVNLILDIFAINSNISRQIFIEFMPILEEIWGINHREIDGTLCISISPEGGPRLALGYIGFLLQKKRMVSLTISYSRHIFHIPGCQVVKLDCAGILV